MDQNTIYLDNHSATKPAGPVLEAMRKALDEPWPPAKDALAARYSMIYDLVGARAADTFVFTSSGAEAICQVHLTAFLELARKEGKCHFVTTAVEDAPLLRSLNRLEELGCYVHMAPLDSAGRVDIDKLSELVGPKTALLSLSLCHGLTGAIQPIDEIARVAHEKGALLHVDATYALGKLASPFQHRNIDYLTFAGDRLHSVQGSGGLFVKEGRPLVPLVLAKPLDAPSLIALALAANHSSLSLDRMNLETARLRDLLEEEVLGRIPDAKALMRGHFRLPNVSVLSFPRVHQEMLLYTLQKNGVFATIGGDATAHLAKHLTACGLDSRSAESSISLTLSRLTTKQEALSAAEILVESVLQLHPLTEGLF